MCSTPMKRNVAQRGTAFLRQFLESSCAALAFMHADTARRVLIENVPAEAHQISEARRAASVLLCTTPSMQ